MSFIPEPKQIYIAFVVAEVLVIRQILGWVGVTPIVNVENELIRLDVSKDTKVYYINREDMGRFTDIMFLKYKIISDLSFD